jgi:hypothetical protein
VAVTAAPAIGAVPPFATTRVRSVTEPADAFVLSTPFWVDSVIAYDR